MKSNLKHCFIFLSGLAIGCFIFLNTTYAETPLKIAIQATLSSQAGGLINGHKKVRVDLMNGTNSLYHEDHPDVLFLNGTCSLIVGSITTFNATLITNLRDPQFKLTITGTDQGFDQNSNQATIPIYAAPFAIQAKVAEDVAAVDASKIKGVFTSPVKINANMQVGTNVLFVNATTKKVGINTTTPNYHLDVNGVVNAEGYQLNGAPIEDVMSWQKQNNSIYYTEGFVGVGTSMPTSNLDVRGNINATDYLIGGVSLKSHLLAGLAWQTADNGTDIYFDDGSNVNGGNVGIGTANPTAKLDVNGAVRIADSPSLSPAAGTLKYADGDFYGYLSDEGWRTLTGLKGSGSDGQLVYWSDAATIAGASAFNWNDENQFLGIGTSNPTAKLEIVATATVPLLHIKDINEKTVFYVASPNVGIGTNTPNQKLTVVGNVDAQGYTVKGQPLEFAFSSRSHWYKENDGRIFYDTGYVGIGTSQPSNLLELASSSGNAALTFDILGENLYTIGISRDNINAFILSQGELLDDPVFVFNRDKIGVGLIEPSANLHVSGNTGVLFVGQFIASADRTASDKFTMKGQGTRMMWAPSHAAFRAGSVLSTNWDDDYLGDYSMGFGFDPLASGVASVVGGGYQNKASGYGATVPGGVENEASGDYSFAAGYKALAKHRSAFVWSDYTPSENSFSSAYANQFVIRANNGVGIGTTDTQGTALTLRRNAANQYLFRGQDSNGLDLFVITTEGKVGIGTSKPGNAQLAIVSGNVGIGTTNPTALLTVDGSAGSGPIFLVKAAESSTAAMLISASGNVGIGVSVTYQFAPIGSETEAPLLVINGGIRASQFKVVDPNNPNASITIQPNPGSPWSSRDDDIYRTQGRVGIGTTAPMSLLELSNGNLRGDWPVITYDINGSDKYSVSVTTNTNGSEYLFVICPSSSITTTPSITIASASVGIGTYKQSPRATLQVSGNVWITGNMAIGYNTVSNPIYSLMVNGPVNAGALYIKGEEFVARQTEWLTNTNTGDLYYLKSNVGIGTSVPQTKLEVVGAVSANYLNLSGALNLSGSLTVSRLYLINDSTEETPSQGILYVEDGSLKYLAPTANTPKIISSPIRKGTQTSGVGELAYWIDNTTIGQSDIIWSQADSKLIVSGNMAASRNYTSGGLRIRTQTEFGAPYAFAVTANLAHNNDLYETDSYTAGKIDLVIEKKWGYPDETQAVSVKGLDISLSSASDTAYLYNGTSATGLYIDVTSANVEGSGHKAAAIFMGGSVGIGTTRPSLTAALEVAGTVSCNAFNLSGGLSVPSLEVNSTSLVASTKLVGATSKPRVGVGISITDVEQQDAELYVNGTISANSVVIQNGLTSTTMNINNGTLVVDASGNVGIGLGSNNPAAQIDIRKEIAQLTDVPDDSFISQKMSVTIAGNEPGKPFYFNKNLTGIDMRYISDASNKLSAEAVGITMNMTRLEVQSGQKVVGLYVDVTGSADVTRYAALFQGGRVGINTDNPLYDLHVSGDMKATNLRLDGTLSASTANFNYLTIEQQMTVNGRTTVNQLVVLDRATINNLVLADNLVAEEGTFSTINAKVGSFNQTLQANTLAVTTVNASYGTFSQSVGIGTTAPTPSLCVLKVSGNVEVVGGIQISDSFVLDSATLNINSGALYTHPDNPYIGIGTTHPQTYLHINASASNAYNANDNTGWNALRIQTLSTAAGVGAGIVLIPDTDTTASGSIGSGIVAINSRTTGTGPSSHLAFISDPNNGPSQERMRLSDTGYLGIGTTVPSAMLHVNGTAQFENAITLNSTVYLSTLTDINSSGLTVTPSGTFAVYGNISANQYVKVERGMYFKATNNVESTANYGRLFVKEDMNLYYQAPDGNPISISAPFVGESGRVPYFNSDGSLSDDAYLYWDPLTNRLIVGTQNILAGTELQSTVNADAYGAIAAQRITMYFKDRSTLSEQSTFTGLNIAMKSADTDSATQFGRLANGEIAIGLKVDVRDLRAKYYNDNLAVTGRKFAALFLGGSVGVGTTDPAAAFHVSNLEAGTIPFRVDAPTQNYALFVDASSRVGIATSTPDARLSIVGASSLQSDAAFNIKNASGTTLMHIANNGYVGINTQYPSANLHVVGTLNATTARFDTLSATTLNVGNGNFVVDASGNIGIGTTNPDSSLVFYKAITSNDTFPTNGFISNKMTLALTGGSITNIKRFNKNMTGLKINFSSSSSSDQLKGTDTTPVATGVSINMADLVMADPATAVGIYVNVTGNTGTRYAALFQGGNVGIGTSEPSEALEVIGTIKATGLTLLNDIAAVNATFNNVFADAVSVNGTVTVNGLVVTNYVSANHLIITGSLTAPTASMTTLNATNGYFMKAAVGITNNTAYTFEVSGNTLISGNAIIDILTVSTLNAKVTTIDIGGDLLATGSAWFSGYLRTDRNLSLKKNQSLSDTNADYGRLYVDSNGDLRYIKPAADPATAVIANLSSLTGTPGQVPHYDNAAANKGNLTDAAYMKWTTANISGSTNGYYFTIGTPNAITSVLIGSKLPNTVFSQDYSCETVSLNFGSRTSASSAVFKGVDIKFTGTSPATDPYDFARLASGETGIGLIVDVRDVAAKYTTGVGSGVSGYKYAAVFLGGNVGMGISQPAAVLHIKPEISGVDALRIDLADSQTALFVGSTGNVGVGTSAPEAKLTIKLAGSEDAFHVANSSGATLVKLTAAGKMGIGTGNPTAMLHIYGTNPARIETTSRPYAFVTDTTGNIGMGISNPQAYLHIVGNTSDPLFRIDKSDGTSALYLSNDGNLGVGLTNPSAKLQVDGMMLAGTSNISGVPTWVQGSDSTYTRGFLASQGADNIFSGVRKNAAGTYDSVIFWSSNESRALRFESDSNDHVFALKPDGSVGFGTSEPSAHLHVRGNMFVTGPSDYTAFSVTNNRVGIGTSDPTSNFHVAGTMVADQIEILSGDLNVSTLNIEGELSIWRSVSQNVNVTAHAIEMVVSDDIQSTIGGLNIKLASATNPQLGRPYTVYGEGIAYGLKVDLSNLSVGDASFGGTYGKKYAAVFIGGNVGIALTQPAAAKNWPAAPLHVLGSNTEMDLARFGSDEGDITLHDYTNGKVGFYLRSSTPVSVYSEALVLDPTTGAVGIGTSELSAAGRNVSDKDISLVVNGDVRVGVKKNTTPTITPGYGNKLWLSGGPDMISGATVDTQDSENDSPLWIARYNAAENQSELRVNIGNHTTGTTDIDRFVVGYTSGTDFKKVLDVRSDGKVAIQSGGESNFEPQAVLHVKGSAGGTVTALDKHLAVFENKNGTQGNILAIHASYDSSVVPETLNFISFLTGIGTTFYSVGCIEGNGASGVRFKTSGADYAEYLPKTDSKERFEKGDVVAVRNGFITKNTTNAQQLFVISTAASVAGNDPGEKARDRYELVSFFGQVPVRIRGQVRAGDYIIPSGYHDGTGIAVHPDAIDLSQAKDVVGRAWEAASDTRIKKVNVAVGFNFNMTDISKEAAAIKTLSDQITELKNERIQIKKQFEKQYQEQSKQIEDLIKKVSEPQKSKTRAQVDTGALNNVTN